MKRLNILIMIFFIIGLLFLPNVARAETFIVNNNFDLQAALSDAATSEEGER